MSEAVVCPNPRCPQPTNAQRIVLSGTGSRSPDAARVRSQRRTVNRRLMEPRTMFGTWGVAGGVSGLLVLVGIYLIAFGPTGPGQNWGLLGAIAAWVVAVVLGVWSSRSHTHPARPHDRANAVHAEPKAQQPIDFYLCNGCGNVFEPSSGRFVPLERAGELLA